MKARGRPKTNARRAASSCDWLNVHSERQRLANVVEVQLALPRHVATKLSVARRSAEFVKQLDAALDRLVIRLAEYPQLRDLAWNRVDEFIPAKEAFQLYERNWRFVDLARLDDSERRLIDRLKVEYGHGEINA